MGKQGYRATVIGIVANSFLFAIKLFAGIFTNSLAITSDAFHSLTDVMSNLGIFFAFGIARKKADRDHPFGHKRAEPIMGLVVALLEGILGFEILKGAITKLATGADSHVYGAAGAVILIISMIIKIAMSKYFLKVGKETRSPAIKANAVDCRNDVLVSLVALIGFLGSLIGVKQLDSVAAIVISIAVFYAGYKIGTENIDYLMGRAPPKEMIKEIKNKAKKTKGVLSVYNIKAHYVGNFVHVELRVHVNKNMKTKQSHKICEKTKAEIEKISGVDRAFVHIEPR